MAETKYTPRLIDQFLGQKIKGLPAIAIDGAKGVGKTSSAKRLASTVIRLDIASEREAVEATPELIMVKEPPILMDEWQRLPEVWDCIRRSVDDNNSPGRFLLTGSAHPIRANIHSGAGRIVRMRMRPLSLEERQLDTPIVRISELLQGNNALKKLPASTKVSTYDYLQEILTSGFPGIRNLNYEYAIDQLDGYINNIVDYEFSEQGLMVRRPQIQTHCF